MAAAASVNPDLASERAKATFDGDQLTYFLYDGPANTRRKRYIQNAVIQEMNKHKFPPLATLSHREQYEQALQRSALALKLEDHLAPRGPREIYYLREAAYPHTPIPHSLHQSMFADVLMRQATEEQQREWLPLAKAFRMIGTYAQTEMGHGTFLRGLETTATYDPATREFVLHSPTVSSIKFWPGGLGKTCNCCILMATLITKGENHGMHPFLLQIRDFESHQPLPGVTVGDIGAKFGYNSIDNGFLRLNNVRVPRTNMLMKNSQVLEDGTYVKPQNARLTYGSMTLIRTNIVGGSAKSLAMAVTIAVRYSAVRRQSVIQPGAGEVKVLDFQTQQMKLLPLVAGAYALQMASSKVNQVYHDAVSGIDKGAMDQLPQLHALSSGLKALSTWEALSGIEQCRMACGGHGFSHASGIPKIYSTAAPNATLEGENTVLMLQVARYLVKNCRAVQAGRTVSNMLTYLTRPPAPCSTVTSDIALSDLTDLYQHAAARMTWTVCKKLDDAGARGQNSAVAWNNHSVELVAAATMHSKLYVVQSMADTVSGMTGLRPVMHKLCQLYSVCGILQDLGHFMEDGYLSGSQCSVLRQGLVDLLADLRPEAVTLVDAFDFPDAVLDSVLGRWDGQVYPALYDWVTATDMNHTQVLDAYYKYQRPYMESQWAKDPKVKAVSRL